MANQYVSKVALSNGTTLIDLTGDTVTEDKLLAGTSAHDKSGAPIEGTCTYDSDTSDATAAAGDIVASTTAYARGAKLTGTMPDRGAVNGEISSRDQAYTIPQGRHDGTGKVQISAAEKAKIIPGNIKAGVEILGQTGSYSGEAITAQSKTVTPSWTQQTVQPDANYDYLSGVTVNAIPITYSDNAAGGQTVTIG